jgi:hypothetical protein
MTGNRHAVPTEWMGAPDHPVRPGTAGLPADQDNLASRRMLRVVRPWSDAFGGAAGATLYLRGDAPDQEAAVSIPAG